MALLVVAVLLAVAALWSLTVSTTLRTGGVVAVGADGATVLDPGSSRTVSCPSLLDAALGGEDDGPCGPPSPVVPGVLVAVAGLCAAGAGALRRRDDELDGRRPGRPPRGSAAASVGLGVVAVGLLAVAGAEATEPGEVQEWYGGAAIDLSGDEVRAEPVETTQCPSMVDDRLGRGYDSSTCRPGGDPTVVVVALGGAAVAAVGAWRLRPVAGEVVSPPAGAPAVSDW